MSFELAHEESLAENAARLARTRLDRVLGALAAIDDKPPTPEAVHESRRDLKKLRALLRLARRTLGEQIYRQENAAYRDAGRVLSAVRDAQVLRHTFDKLRGELTGIVPMQALDAMRCALAAAVPTAESVFGPGGRLPEITAWLTAARERVDHWPQPGRNGHPWREPSRRLAAAYRGGRKAWRRAGADDAAERDFHEWRKRVKHLVYHFRLLRPFCETAFKKAAKRLSGLSDLLGNEHDLAVLAETLTRNHPGLPEAVATVNRHIEFQRRELRGAALKEGARLYRRKPRRFKKWLKRHHEKPSPDGAE